MRLEQGGERGGSRAWALGFLLGLAACGSEAPTDGAPFSPVATVEVATLQPEPLRNVVEIPGQLESEHTVWVRSEIEGIIGSIEFDEGQEVEAEQILFRLRDDEQTARLREAEAELALAEEVHRRTQKLANQNVSSAAQLDRARAERGIARARVELARVQLERTRIPAPFTGVLGARAVSIGERVGEETQLVQLDSLDRLQLVFSLPEVAVGIVQPGAPVRIRVAPYPEERFDGEVFFVSPTLDPLGRRMVLKAWIPNPDGRLRPGLFATIEAEIERREDALIVPETAVVHDVDGIYVWRVGDDDAAERVPVVVGLHVDGRVEVREGLQAGDEIVTAGTHKLQEGAAIERATPPPPAHAMGGGEPETGS
ncbi:MAG: efflux RND transporter periplasmic adaptor subunit [Myxococcota bacterium]